MCNICQQFPVITISVIKVGASEVNKILCVWLTQTQTVSFSVVIMH